MRHIPPSDRAAWSTYIAAAREDAGLSKAELGRRIGVARETVSRWEAGAQRPEQAEIVLRIADVLELDLEEAYAAAGLRPDVPAPAAPVREPDPELDLIRASRLSDARKKELIAYVLNRRARDERARLEDLEHMLREA